MIYFWNTKSRYWVLAVAICLNLSLLSATASAGPAMTQQCVQIAEKIRVLDRLLADAAARNVCNPAIRTNWLQLFQLTGGLEQCACSQADDLARISMRYTNYARSCSSGAMRPPGGGTAGGTVLGVVGIWLALENTCAANDDYIPTCEDKIDYFSTKLARYLLVLDSWTQLNCQRVRLYEAGEDWGHLVEELQRVHRELEIARRQYREAREDLRQWIGSQSCAGFDVQGLIDAAEDAINAYMTYDCTKDSAEIDPTEEEIEECYDAMQ